MNIKSPTALIPKANTLGPSDGCSEYSSRNSSINLIMSSQNNEFSQNHDLFNPSGGSSKSGLSDISCMMRSMKDKVGTLKTQLADSRTYHHMVLQELRNPAHVMSFGL